MKSRWNFLTRCFRLIIVVEMVLGSTIYFPAITLASAPGEIPSAPDLQNSNHAPAAADDPVTTDEDTPVTFGAAKLQVSAQNPYGVLHFMRNSKDGVLGFSKKLFLSRRLVN